MTDRDRYPNKLPTLVSLDELSKEKRIVRYEVSKERLKELTDSGYLPHYEVDGRQYYQKQEVVAWIENNLAQERDGMDFPRQLIVLTAPTTERAQTIPPELEALDGDLHEINGLWYPTCVYFLVLDNEIQYVGQSANILSRIQQHVVDKKTFDRVFYLPVPKSELNTVEGEFIKKLRPPLNRSRLPGEVKP
jgi:hypothetical protein